MKTEEDEGQATEAGPATPAKPAERAMTALLCGLIAFQICGHVPADSKGTTGEQAIVSYVPSPKNVGVFAMPHDIDGDFTALHSRNLMLKQWAREGLPIDNVLIWPHDSCGQTVSVDSLWTCSSRKSVESYASPVHHLMRWSNAEIFERETNSGNAAGRKIFDGCSSH
jgi:hypothetical protein